RALLLPLPPRRLRIAREHLEVDDRAEPEVGRRSRSVAGDAVVGGGGDPRGERLDDAEPRHGEHLLRLEAALALDVRADPGSERRAVSEARVDRVLEMRVRVDEARQDRGRTEVALGAPLPDLDD